MSRRLLVVAAHPDDEVLGCGGLIARTLREGGACHIVILTEGCTTQYPGRPELIERKRHEAEEAARRLGGASLTLAGLPDMRLSTLPPADVNRPIEDALAEFAPDWVLVHHAGDVNRDHQMAHEAARVACRPRNERFPRLIAYETPSATEWGAGPFQPNLYVRLDADDLERKVASFGAYETEGRPAPHPRSPEALRDRARVRGAESGIPFAEAFVTVWERF